MAVSNLKGFEQWSHLGFDGKLIFRKPLDIPFVTYSNHVPCYEANAYIHKLIVRNSKKRHYSWICTRYYSLGAFY